MKKTYEYKTFCRNCHGKLIFKIPFGTLTYQFIGGQKCTKCGCNINGSFNAEQVKLVLKETDERIKKIGLPKGCKK